jgi:hypothetical protein
MAVVLILILLPVIICLGSVGTFMFASVSELLIGLFLMAMGLGAVYGLLHFMRSMETPEA